MPGNNKKRARKLTRGVLLLQDNAHMPAHVTSCHDCCATEGSEILPLPPYSPDMAPSDLNLFRKIEIPS